MIEIFKILNGIYDPNCCTFIPLWKDSAQRISTSTNPQKIYPQRANTRLRQNCFTIRASKLWNTLPECIIEAKSLNCFKNRLDKHWVNIPIRYDYRANSHSLPTGTRTEVGEDKESGGEEP